MVLLGALGISGYIYELFRDQMPQWKLVGLIIVGMCVCFAAYRFALNKTLRKP